MTCAEARELIGPYVDGELDKPRCDEFELHLKDCVACQIAIVNHTSLSRAIREGYEYEETPVAVRERIYLREAPRWRGFWPGLALGAAAMFLFFFFWPKATLPTAELVASHVRSMAGQLVEVPSSDRHTVKPWFQGKLEFSPDVMDLAADGFPLKGGRLEHFGGHAAAALVYRRRAHVINVFVTGGEPKPGQAGDQQGFHVRHFALHGMDYWVVSDVSLADMAEFERLFVAAATS